MQAVENMPDGWSGVITDLTAKRQQTLDHLDQLRAEKQPWHSKRLSATK
jgi:hypothetical protein